jgi:hypothetical protein
LTEHVREMLVNAFAGDGELEQGPAGPMGGCFATRASGCSAEGGSDDHLMPKTGRRGGPPARLGNAQRKQRLSYLAL